jgi:phage gpG-like protein
VLSVTLTGDRELIERLDAMPAKVQAALFAKVNYFALRLEEKVKKKLSGEVLNVRSGNLRRSIASDVTQSPTSVVGRVYSSGDVKYAGIHEFGGQTKAHIIEAVNAKALAFQAGGKQVFAKRVKHPGSKIPERSYLRTSLAEMREEIVEGLREAAVKAAQT